MAELKLLPCPFCGGEAEIIVIEKGVKSIIRCKTYWCGFERHSYNNGDTDEHAASNLVSVWNTRTQAPTKSSKVNEYRKKHKRCRTCKHFENGYGVDQCNAKCIIFTIPVNFIFPSGCFCKIYEPKEYKDG